MNTIITQPAELLSKLIQFDTTNPPGNEAACIAYIAELIESAGIETQILAKAPNRPNVVARLKGNGSAPPLLLYGHVDVVTTVGQEWEVPPFEGRIADGFVWGRGALDMKGGVAMLLSAFLQAHTSGIELAGDVIFAAVSDEEAMGIYGVRFLVDHYPEYFEGVKYALGEFGGFSLSISGKRFYPIQVAEKQVCWIKATVRGKGGHGSMPLHGEAMARFGKLLEVLDEKKLPVHITPSARMMFEGIADGLGGIQGWMIRQVLNPMWTDIILKILGESGAVFAPLLRHTASPTMLSGGEKVNVIPSEVTVQIDGRILPGFGPEDLIKELQEIAGKDVEFEVAQFEPGPSEPDMGMFDQLADVLKAADPDGTPVPFFLPGSSDARLFSALGIQTYGFLPMPLPEEFNFAGTIHGANERVPVEAVSFGTGVILEVLKQFK